MLEAFRKKIALKKDLGKVYMDLNAFDKHRLSSGAKELLESECVQFILSDQDARYLEELKSPNTDTEGVIALLRSMNTLKLQLEHWANQSETNLELVTNGRNQ